MTILQAIKKLFRFKDKIKTSKPEIIVQIIVVFILPVLLMQFGFIPVEARIWVLVAVVTMFIFLLRWEKWTLKILHLERRSLVRYFWPYLIFTVIGVLTIIFGSELIGRDELALWWKDSHFIYIFFIVSVFQEIGYRGYLMPALQKVIGNPFWVVIINASSFAYMHIIFPNPLINLPVAFAGGLAFALMYRKYPNLLLIALSHAAFNFFAVLYGFFIMN